MASEPGGALLFHAGVERLGGNRLNAARMPGTRTCVLFILELWLWVSAPQFMGTPKVMRTGFCDQQRSQESTRSLQLAEMDKGSSRHAQAQHQGP